MRLNGKNKALFFALAALLAATPASAKVYLNSMCTMKANSPNRSIDGDKNENKKFPLASISKLATSLWAVETLGSDYRFTTKIHVTPTGNNSVDVHIEGGKDPIFGRNVGYFILAQLNRADINIKSIENLSFDENFLMEWNVEDTEVVAGDTPYYTDITKQAAHIIHELNSGMGTSVSADGYRELHDRAAQNGVVLPTKLPSVKINNITYKAKDDYRKDPATVTYVYKSAPLYRILKSMNNRSNNYIADHLYWNLGGTEAFNEYIKEKLSLTTADLEFNLGSGNNADYISHQKEDYNEGTCDAMVSVIWRLNDQLNRQGHVLSDILAVAQSDKNSTLKNYGGTLAGATVAKTGTVDRAKTLAGSVSTRNGTIYFVILVNMADLSEQHRASNFIKDTLRDLITKNKGPAPIKYSPILPLPFDRYSTLTIEQELKSSPQG